MLKEKIEYYDYLEYHSYLYKIILNTMFTSTCSICSTLIETKKDQTSNPNFRCKTCPKSTIRSKQNTHDISMDVKYGSKVIPGWNNYYLSFILPTIWTKNDVRCNRCHKRFLSSTVPDFCPSCTDYYPVDLTCTKCNKIEQVAPRSFKKHDNMCLPCFNSSIYEFKCDFCKIAYNDSHNSFNMLNKHVCPKCRENDTYKKQLLLNYDKNHNELIDSILQLHDNIFVEVTYKVEHYKVGYCYYHDNYYSSNTTDEDITHTQRFPLMKMFDPSDVSNLVSNQDFINFYTIPDESQCDNGCSLLIYTIILYSFRETNKSNAKY